MAIRAIATRMIEVEPQARVPLRLVLASLLALWACYFIVATLRGMFMGFDLGWPIVSRRLTICVLSFMVMAALIPLLQLFDRKSFRVRLGVVLVGALPVALGLSLINSTIFADIQAKVDAADARLHDPESEVGGKVRITQDDAGNLLVDLPPVPPPAPPAPGASAVPAPPAAPVGEEAGKSGVTIRTFQDDVDNHWALIADTAFGRYFLVLAWAALYFALVKAEEARVAERRESAYRRAAEAAELRSLRYQVNPHFLFNTLNSLSALVMTERSDDAETMIQTLSTFYRRTLSGDPTGDSPLLDEIEMQQLYLAIEAVRFPRRLLVEIAVDADVADAKVPGMILQPLVENSVKYAVAATQEPVTITIAASREEGGLALSVSDDGPGRSKAEVPGFGIGLGNVRDRLRARYGEAARIVYGQRSEGGFRTVLHLPLELDE